MIEKEKLNLLLTKIKNNTLEMSELDEYIKELEKEYDDIEEQLKKF